MHQILAHQPACAKVLTRQKAVQISLPAACDTIMKPLSAAGEFTGFLLKILCASCLMASLLLSSGPATCRASARCCHPLHSTNCSSFFEDCATVLAHLTTISSEEYCGRRGCHLLISHVENNRKHYHDASTSIILNWKRI